MPWLHTLPRAFHLSVYLSSPAPLSTISAFSTFYPSHIPNYSASYSSSALQDCDPRSSSVNQLPLCSSLHCELQPSPALWPTTPSPRPPRLILHPTPSFSIRLQSLATLYLPHRSYPASSTAASSRCPYAPLTLTTPGFSLSQNFDGLSSTTEMSCAQIFFNILTF